MKSLYMSSISTCPPHIPQPTAVPTIAASEIGALNSRWYGRASVSPVYTPYAPPQSRLSSP